MCNSFYYLRGGSERCFFDLTEVLSSHGHEVVPFSMLDERNFPTSYSEYFLSNCDFSSQLGAGGSVVDKLKAVERVIYSREAAHQIKRLIDDTKPDIAHLHLIAHEISPSILPVIKLAGIPVVQTLHDYKLLCPNTTFISNGRICEECKTHRYYQVVLNRCKRGSWAASGLAGLEMYAHKAMRLYERYVDTYIVPSRFLQGKLEEYSVPTPTLHLPNFLYLERFEPCYEPDDYFVYSGRLVAEKGILTLIKAMDQVKRSHLFIAGAGDLEDELKTYVKDHELQNVTFLGHLPSDKLISLVQKAQFSVMPSEWYENYSMSVIESLACATPVLGSHIGGIPEQIKDGWNGLLFDPGNVDQLAEKINYLLDNPQSAIEFGHNGRLQVERTNNPEIYYREIMSLYESLVA